MHRSLLLLSLVCACGASQPAVGVASPPPTCPQAPAAPVCPDAPPPIVVPCDAAAADRATSTATSTGDDRLTLTRVGFDELPGWVEDRHAEAVVALRRSCEKLATLADDAAIGSSPYGGRAGQWRAACAAASRLPDGDDAAARRFFEREFVPYATRGQKGARGKVTGYYVQGLRASRSRGGAYQFPLFARPPDLLEIQLSDFIADGRSRRIWGQRVGDDGTVAPYPVRAKVRERGLDDGRVLLWVDDPVDAFAVEIEGSGRATLDTGEEAWVAFAGKNGLRPRRTGAIARALRELRKRQGKRPFSERDLASYFTITDPREAMVFFEIESRAGAIGTQDVILTPRRSAAVDRAVIALSTPMWVESKAPTSAKGRTAPWRQLVVAQDTGGSILGSVRVDVYFGADAEARAIGRRVHHPGRVWLLLPRGLNVPTEGGTR